MTSSRLAGKVLSEIGGQPALGLLLARLRAAREVAQIVVASSCDASDDPIVALVEGLGYRMVRGPLTDVLERYRVAAEQVPSDAVVRITGDCPLIDPDVVDLVIARWRAGTAVYVANCVEPFTYPDGLDVEVISTPALRVAAREATLAVDREHVTPFLRSDPQRFPAEVVVHEPPSADVRVTLDTTADLRRLRAVVAQVGTDAGLEQIVDAARAISIAARASRGGRGPP